MDPSRPINELVLPVDFFSIQTWATGFRMPHTRHKDRPLNPTAERRRAHLKAWITAQGLTVTDVAHISGINRGTLNSYVSGNQLGMNGITQEKIAAAFRCTVEELFGPAAEIEVDAQPGASLDWIDCATLFRAMGDQYAAAQRVLAANGWKLMVSTGRWVRPIPARRQSYD